MSITSIQCRFHIKILLLVTKLKLLSLLTINNFTDVKTYCRWQKLAYIINGVLVVNYFCKIFRLRFWSRSCIHFVSDMPRKQVVAAQPVKLQVKEEINAEVKIFLEKIRFLVNLYLETQTHVTHYISYNPRIYQTACIKRLTSLVSTEAATVLALWKILFLKISQYSHENTCVGVSY